MRFIYLSVLILLTAACAEYENLDPALDGSWLGKVGQYSYRYNVSEPLDVLCYQGDCSKLCDFSLVTDFPDLSTLDPNDVITGRFLYDATRVTVAGWASDAVSPPSNIILQYDPNNVPHITAPTPDNTNHTYDVIALDSECLPAQVTGTVERLFSANDIKLSFNKGKFINSTNSNGHMLCSAPDAPDYFWLSAGVYATNDAPNSPSCDFAPSVLIYSPSSNQMVISGRSFGNGGLSSLGILEKNATALSSTFIDSDITGTWIGKSINIDTQTTVEGHTGDAGVTEYVNDSTITCTATDCTIDGTTYAHGSNPTPGVWDQLVMSEDKTVIGFISGSKLTLGVKQ